MNVTNIGSPIATPASQPAGADAATGTGFAGLLGTGNAAQGGLVFGTPVFGAFATMQPATITAQTGAALLPGGSDAGAVAVSSDRPQVAMTQLLATAAPVAAAPAVVAGGNPLADAIAKALAAPGATPTAPEAGAAAAVAPADTAAILPTTGDATPKAAAAAVPDTSPKVAASRLAAATKISAEDAPTQPPVDEAVALDAPATPEAEGPTLPQAAVPAKGGGKQLRTVPSDDLPSVPDAAIAQPQSLPQPQPIAVPQATTAQPAPTAPAAARTVGEAKSDGAGAVRTAKMETASAGTAAPAPTTAEKATELARAVSGQAGNSGTDGNTKGDGGQQPFAQQLAAADTRHAAFQPFSAASPVQAATPAATGHATTPTSSEPVINGRVGELGRSLGVEIARKVDAGEDTLRVRLNPAELGRVEVTLAFDDNGRVQATMRAESQQTLDLLRQDAPDLGRALDQAGIRSDAGSFRFESRDGGTGSNASGQSASQQQSQSRGSNQQFQDEPEIQAAAYRPVRSDGQVDLIA